MNYGEAKANRKQQMMRYREVRFECGEQGEDKGRKKEIKKRNREEGRQGKENK